MIYAVAAAPFVALIVASAVTAYAKFQAPLPYTIDIDDCSSYEFGGPPYHIPVTKVYVYNKLTSRDCAGFALDVMEKNVADAPYEYLDLVRAMQYKLFPNAITHNFFVFTTDKGDLVAWAITTKTNGVVRWRNTTRRLNEIEICHLQVAPKYRRKGYGRAIVGFIHNQSVDGVPRSHAPERSILECRSYLAPFYKAADFHPTTEPMGHSGTAPDHVWLVRKRAGSGDA